MHIMKGMRMFSKLLDLLNGLRPRQLLLLAGGSALLMFGLLYFALSGLTKVKQAPAAPEEFRKPMRSVVVARENIPPRTVIQESMLEIKDMPFGTEPQGAAISMEEVVNRPAISTIFEGDVITMQKVFTDQSQVGFVGTIPMDCRAVSVGVSEITGVAGFAKPGDHVDVVLVEKGEEAATSRLLLQDVLLLGVNQDMEGDGGKGKEHPAIATLALEPDNALKVVSAAAVGELYLILRPFQPRDSRVDEPSYTLRSSYLAKGKTKDPETTPQAPRTIQVPAPAPAPAPVAPSSGIQIIQGDQIVTK